MGSVNPGTGDGRRHQDRPEGVQPGLPSDLAESLTRRPTPPDPTPLLRAAVDALDLPAGPVAFLATGGVNHAWVVGAGDDRWVLRTPIEAGEERFELEAWCAERARAAGVATPEVLGFGTLDDPAHPRAWQVQRFVPGHGTGPLGDDRHWRALGEWAATITRITPDDAAPGSIFTRFGRDIDAAWRQHVDYNLESLGDADALLARGVITRDQQASLRATVRELQGVRFSQGLSHGDLARHNLLVADDGVLWLLDWGCASFGPVPYTDWFALDRQVRRGEPVTRHNIEVFLASFASRGAGPAADPELFAAFRRLQHLDLCRWAIDRKPERFDEMVRDLHEVL